MRSLAGLFVFCSIGIAQAPPCVRDAAGSQVCAITQADSNVCGYQGFFGRTTPYYCNDVAVERTTAGGQRISRRVLSGNSDDRPAAIFLDAQGNAVVTGTTYSSNFPVTPDAAYNRNAGPAPYSPDSYPLLAGGDVFVSMVSPAGELLYSTFLGSSLSDTVIGARMASTGEVDILVGTGGDFPVTGAALAGGPVLVSFDPPSHKIVRSLFLPIAPAGAPTSYAAAWRADGDIGVTTPGAIMTFTRTGQLRSTTSLESFEFGNVPSVFADPAGDLWVTGRTRTGPFLVTRLVNGVVEAFRWLAPSDGYLNEPLFTPDGIAYFVGNTYHALEPTANALLRAPCTDYSLPFVVALSSQGDVKLLSYLPEGVSSMAVSGREVIATFNSGRTIPITLDSRPALACLLDPFRSLPAIPFAHGQVVRLRGGNFGPAVPLTASPDITGRFPKMLAGYTVDVAGITAPILSASAGDIVFVMPFQSPEGSDVAVNLLERGTRIATLPVGVSRRVPRALDAVVNADGSINDFRHPSPWGSTIILFVTGAGNTVPPLDDGEVAPGPRVLAVPVTMSFLISGPAPESGTILYAGAAPGIIAGLTQINIQLPPARAYSYSSIYPQLTIAGIPVFLPSIYVK